MRPLTESQLEDRYNEMLDDVHGRCEIAGLEYATSYALKNLDETAYSTGFNDWLDGEIRDGVLFEYKGEYYNEDPTDGEETDDNEE